MSTIRPETQSSISLCGLLGLLFIALKLTDHITWPWLWVLSPFWAPLALGVLVVLGIVLAAFVMAMRDGMRYRRRQHE